MKYSIVVPVYNGEKYLKTCVDSLLLQESEDFEIVIVDDGSTDKSPDICDELCRNCKRVRVVHQQNRGSVDARRTGVKTAKGEYILFCDSDDYWSNNLLKEINNIVDGFNPDVVIFGANLLNSDTEDTLVWKNHSEGFVRKEDIYDELLLDCSITSMWMKACRRTLFDLDSDYSMVYGHNFGDDTLQSFGVIKKANTIYYLPKPLYCYRKGSGMTSKYSPDYYNSFRIVNKAVRSILSEKELEDCIEKLDFHLVMRAYDAIGNMAGTQSFPKQTVMEIACDNYFNECYGRMIHTTYAGLLNRKQKCIIHALITRKYVIIRAFITLKRKLKRG